MRVTDLMTTKLVSIRRDATIGDAIESLVDAHVLALPVIDEHDQLVGVLSTTDVLEAVAERGRRGDAETLLDNTLVSELMTIRPVTVDAQEDVKVAAQQMLYGGIHRIFVEEEGRLVGVISQSDLVQAMATGHA